MYLKTVILSNLHTPTGRYNIAFGFKGEVQGKIHEKE